MLKDNSNESKHTHSTHSSRHTYTEINLKEYLHPSKEGSRYSAVWFPGPRHHIWPCGCVVKIYVKVLKDRASLRGEGASLKYSDLVAAVISWQLFPGWQIDYIISFPKQ